MAQSSGRVLVRAEADDLEAVRGCLADALDRVFVVLGCGVCARGAAVVVLVIAAGGRWSCAWGDQGGGVVG